MHTYSGMSGNQLWCDALHDLKGPLAVSTDGRGGATREILHASFCISNPTDRWVHSRVPAMNPAFAIAEVFWILCGRKDSKGLKYWNSKISDFAGNTDVFHGAYGDRLRVNLGFDQLERAYLALTSNPSSRQVVLQIWDGKLDLPDADGEPQSQDIPCNIISMLKVREGKLHWTQVLRSNDIFLGLPHNFIQFTMLQEIIAGWLGVGLGSYIHICDSLHLYEQDCDVVRINGSTANKTTTSSLMLSYAEFVKILPICETIINELESEIYSLQKLGAIKNQIDSLPLGYGELLRILLAESCRRRKFREEADNTFKSIKTPFFNDILACWWERCHFKRV